MLWRELVVQSVCERLQRGAEGVQLGEPLGALGGRGRPPAVDLGDCFAEGCRCVSRSCAITSRVYRPCGLGDVLLNVHDRGWQELASLDGVGCGLFAQRSWARSFHILDEAFFACQSFEERAGPLPGGVPGDAACDGGLRRPAGIRVRRKSGVHSLVEGSMLSGALVHAGFFTAKNRVSILREGTARQRGALALSLCNG